MKVCEVVDFKHKTKYAVSYPYHSSQVNRAIALLLLFRSVFALVVTKTFVNVFPKPFISPSDDQASFEVVVRISKNILVGLQSRL